ncbi:hypothetical protein LPJ73_000109 [Coemansia sp. RSA 2703]|nr:hypothetical protein LPJ73_000109 [Coemansia sp. RSA 2703]KAJ2379537.1 hypothetical protein IW150_000080 [Coemansia sp. RSA 2607]KAJ2398444.1 hypothetical protein GGI05_000076 [Coemansia sp. RSA 2603]
MCAKLERFTSEVGFPIGCIGVTQNNEIVLGGGGGAGRSGVKNKLSVYSIDSKGRMLKPVCELVLSSDEDAPTCLAVHPKERVLVSSINRGMGHITKGENANLRVFELKKKSIKEGKATMTVCSTNDFDYQKCVVFDPSGKLVAGGSTNGTLAVLNYPQLTHAFPFIEAADEVNDLDFNSSGKWLTVATDDELKVVSTKNGSLVQTIDNPHTTSGTSAVFRFARFGHSKGVLSGLNQQGTVVDIKNVLYTVMNTRTRKQAYIAIWDTQTWTRLTTRPVCNSAITTFALSRDGKLLAFATASLSIVICDARTLRVLLRIPAAHSFAITALAFDRDTKYLISGSADESCQVTVLPDQWPTAFDAVAEIIMSNLQTFIVLLVIVFAIMAALYMRS